MKNLQEEKSKVTSPTKARQRIEALFDAGTFKELDAFSKSCGESCGVITGYGEIFGLQAYAFSQDVTADKGAINLIHADKLVKLYKLAAKTGLPVIGIYDSCGAKISDGAKILNAYAKIAAMASKLSGVVPQISYVAGVCGGMSATVAAMADFVIMNKDAELFISAPSNTKLAGAGSAENAAKSGTVSIVADDDDSAIQTIKNIVSALPSNNLSAIPVYEYEEPAAVSFAAAKDAALSVADSDSETELYADFGKTAYTAVAKVNGSAVGIASAVGGKLNSDDCTKIAKLVSVCDSYSIPVITIIDTEGFDITSEDELSGSIRDTAKLTHTYAEATTPKIAVITGKAVGSAYMALSNADIVFALENAVIAPLSAATAVEFTSHDEIAKAENKDAKRAELEKAYEDEMSAFAAAADGFVNEIVTPAEVRSSVASALDVLSGKRVTKLPKKHSNFPF